MSDTPDTVKIVGKPTLGEAMAAAMMSASMAIPVTPPQNQGPLFCSGCGREITASSPLHIQNGIYCNKACYKEQRNMVRDAQRGK